MSLMVHSVFCSRDFYHSLTLKFPCVLPKLKHMSQKIAGASASHLRVLLFDHTAALGGGEIALLNLVRHLDLRKIKPVVVLGAEGPLAEQLRLIVDTHVLPLSPRVTGQRKDKLGITSLFRIRDIVDVLAYMLRLARFIRANDIHLVHTNSLKADIIGGIAGRLSSRPVVWHVRDRIEDDYLPRSVVRIFRLLCRLIPSYVITNSAATLRTLRLKPDFRSTAIHSGVELNEHVRIASVVHDGTSTPMPPARDSSAQGLFRIGLIGRISPWKGQHVFIHAAAQVVQRFPKVKFLIVGSALFGEDLYEREVRQLVTQLGVELFVGFTGFRTDVKQAIADLDVVVHASTKGEPFGQVIIEGMAAGKPIVATNGGGVPEIVKDGVTGILVPMEDASAMAEAICRICADPVLAKAMGSSGKKRVAEHFTIEQTARKVESVYVEMRKNMRLDQA
jgi:glycosyltransferase involved in cell wall biosynthesis